MVETRPVDQRRDLTLHQMRCFLAVIEAGSVSRAAARLGISQSAMSRLLAQMESALGTVLAERTHHGLNLTGSGQALRQACHEILQANEAMRSEIDALSGQVRGTCRVAMPESVGRVLFLPLVQSISAQHSDSTLRVMAAFSAAMPELLLSGQLDVAVVTNTHSHAGLVTEALAHEEFVLIGRPGDAVVADGTIWMQALAELPLILTAWSGGIRAPIDAAMVKAQVEPEIRLEIDSNSAIIDLVQAGEGCSILPYSAVHREVSSGLLNAAVIREPAIMRRLLLATPANRPVSMFSRAVLAKVKSLAVSHAALGGWTV